MMDKMILFFGYTDFSGRMMAGSLQKILSQNGYTGFLIEGERYGQTLAEIVLNPHDTAVVLNSQTPESAPSGEKAEALSCRFILFCGMNGADLDLAVSLCRGQIRALLTPSNSRMTVYQLAEHLAAEAQADRGRTGKPGVEQR